MAIGVCRHCSKTFEGTEEDTNGPNVECVSCYVSLAARRLSEDVTEKVEPVEAGESEYTVESARVTQYLNDLVWDRTPRLNSWLAQVFGLDNTPEISTMGAKWLIGAVARWSSPGCRMDFALVFCGPQGLGKTVALETLCGPMGLGRTVDLKATRNSEHLIYVVSYPLYWSGLEEAICQTSDSYRLPYQQPKDIARKFVLAVETNEMPRVQCKRRLGVVPVTRPANIELLREQRDQLWAEAVARYSSGELWFVEG